MPPTNDVQPEHGGRSGAGLSGDAFRYAGLGVQFAGTLLVFGAIGYALDHWLGTLPWLLVAGVLLGFVGGTISMVRRVFPPRANGTSGVARRDDPTSHEPH
jgi:F0F1-type ATP synthase assembly protein I